MSTTPGIHQQAQENLDYYSFSKTEKFIILYWANEWYVTHAEKIMLGKSEYRYFTIKATETYEESLGISREIVVVFSRYEFFEARTLDAYDEIVKKFQEQRLEKICYVLISADLNITSALQKTLSNQETQIIIPFTYKIFDEMKGDPHFLRNQFRSFFYSRDLFDFSGPLKKDIYFFGRNDIVVEVIDKHKQFSNSGLFGLRKTGKTSLIYDILRKLPQKDAIGIFIDCQDTAFNQKRWNHALCYIIQNINNQYKLNMDNINEEIFTETQASTYFKQHLININKKLNKSILILFDEIENITFGKSPAKHWCDGLDFIFFWQSLRSIHQSTDNIFSFCILGTNPQCIEVPTISGKDNPIFNAFYPKYITGFDEAQTREMVRKLGRLMGITFEESIYSKLTEEYGGHPFLIRRLCSAISKTYRDRPITISRLKYTEAKNKFNEESDYFGMILEVLQEFYPDELDMLKILAADDYEDFFNLANDDYSLVKHLVGYGIVKKTGDSYDFKIDSIKGYLLRQDNRKKRKKSPDENWSEICISRNNLELKLRNMVKNILRIAYKNESDAKNYVLKKVFSENKKYLTYSYSDLFDSRKSDIYLSHLQKLILNNWEYFQDFFNDQSFFKSSMDILNHEGRFDAHASILKDSEVKLIEHAISWIQNGINKYEKNMST